MSEIPHFPAGSHDVAGTSPAGADGAVVADEYANLPDPPSPQPQPQPPLPPPPYSGEQDPTGQFPSIGGSPRRRGLPLIAVASIAVAAMLVGAGIGHLGWSIHTVSSAAPNPGVGSPFGSGSSGNGGSPFGSGSSGNSSTGAGAPSDISAIASKVDPGLVDINTNLSYQNEQAAGTGMVLTASGEILTNNHVIDGATSISVTDVGNGKTYTAKVVGYDRTGDVAVLKLTGARGLQTVSASSGTAAVGQAVVAVGNAGGAGGTPSAAGGSITATGKSITASDGGGGNTESLSGLIEINAGIQPGDSGGSLVNTAGLVIGMDTAASASSGYQDSSGQGYAIPIATALSIANQIESGHGSSTVHIGATAFLGVEVQPSSSTGGGRGFGGGAYGSAGGATTPGALVDGVLSGSPAQQAGLAGGDVITALDGQSVNSSSDLTRLLAGDHPGATVQLQWTDQGGQTHSANVKLASGPAA